MRMVWLAISAAACTGGKPGGGDWARRPLEHVTGTVGGAGTSLSYSLDLPAGLARDAASSDVTHDYEFAPGGKHDLTAPSVMVGFEAIAPRSLDEFVASTTPFPDDEVVRKAPIDGGYVAITRASSRKHWKVNVIKIVGDRGVGCMAQQASDVAELGDATRALLEKVCLSLAVK